MNIKKLEFTFFFACFLLLCLTVFSQTNNKNDETDKMRTEALKLYEKGKFTESLNILESIVEIKRSNSGKNSVEVGKALYDLAIIEVAAGKRKSANGTFLKSIKIFESQKELTSIDQNFLSIVYGSMGILKYKQEKTADSVDYLKKALKLKIKVYKPDSMAVAQVRWQLANMYFKNMQYKDAKNLFKVIIESRLKYIKKSNSGEVNDALVGYECMCERVGFDLNSKIYIDEVKEVLDTIFINRTIEGGWLNGKAISLPGPIYPATARGANLKGNVEVQVIVDKDGYVTFACAKSGPKLFFRSVERAALRARFEPTLLRGKPMKVIGKIVYKFQ